MREVSNLNLRHPSSETLDIWIPAMKNASAYWMQLASEIRLSDNFRAIALKNIKALDELSPIARNITQLGGKQDSILN